MTPYPPKPGSVTVIEFDVKFDITQGFPVTGFVVLKAAGFK